MTKMRERRRAESVSDQLRRFIRDSGISRYKLCELSGVDPSHLHRFYHGSGGLSTDTLDKICEALGLCLTKSDREER